MKKFFNGMGPVTVYFDNKLFTGEKVCSLQRSVL